MVCFSKVVVAVRKAFSNKRTRILSLGAFAAICISWGARSRGTRQSDGGVSKPDFDAYRFEDLVSLPATSVKVQGASGTCWTFAGISLLESELIRKTHREYDLSEMYVVRGTYQEKARNYILRQGTARFTDGALIHDVLISAAKHGVVTESWYPGMTQGKTMHDHRKMLPALAAVVTNHAKPAQALGNGWPAKLESVFDQHMGRVPPASPDGEFASPQDFLKRSALDIADYVTITSFAHAPFYEPFILEIPANFSSQRFYNLPIDEFIANVSAALDAGFTLALDGDFTEPFFGNGVAVLPEDGTSPEHVTGGKFGEKEVTQELRQLEFESFRTTDDHLVHITGKARDQFGRRYFKAKNCWGVIWGREGYVYISEAYLKMKAISVTVHRDGLMSTTKASLKARN